MTKTKFKRSKKRARKRDILEALKDDPAVRHIFSQNPLDNDVTDHNPSSGVSATKPKIEDL